MTDTCTARRSARARCRRIRPLRSSRSHIRPAVGGVTSSAAARSLTRCGPREASTTSARYWAIVVSSAAAPSDMVATATRVRLAVSTASTAASSATCSVTPGTPHLLAYCNKFITTLSATASYVRTADPRDRASRRERASAGHPPGQEDGQRCQLPAGAGGPVGPGVVTGRSTGSGVAASAGWPQQPPPSRPFAQQVEHVDGQEPVLPAISDRKPDVPFRPTTGAAANLRRRPRLRRPRAADIGPQIAASEGRLRRAVPPIGARQPERGPGRQPQGQGPSRCGVCPVRRRGRQAVFAGHPP